MRRGFIFNHELCVGCKACSASCMLENGWSFRSRNIYSTNTECFAPYPVINLSMACNHCNDPVCLRGCPTGAYRKDGVSGAVVIDPDKCMGCRYCIWNCPYDAPKYNRQEGIIEKCHFCFHRLEEEVEPACSSSCPTGALGFGEIPEEIINKKYSWIPEKNINPSLLITGNEEYCGPVIIPDRSGSEHASLTNTSEKVAMEWSLVGFTFLTILSVAVSISDLFNVMAVSGLFEIMLIVLAVGFSVFHLGKKLKAWKALGNLRGSPLSREIALFIFYTVLVILKQFIIIPYSGIIVFVAGISLVLIIDSVYSFSNGGKISEFHSGQAILTVMLMVSFMLDMVYAFIFVAMIKGILIIFRIREERRRGVFVFRFMRLAFLIISVMALVVGTEGGRVITMFIFFSGELADRMIFYIDFKPVNIKSTIIYKIK
jgi:Fe-S-cluster-containing dehydrogenase component